MRAIKDMIIAVVQRLLSILPIRKDLIIFESNGAIYLKYRETKGYR